MPKITTPIPRINIKKKKKEDKVGYLFFTLRWNGNRVVYPIGGYIDQNPVEGNLWNVAEGKIGNKFTYSKYQIDNNKLESLKNHFAEFIKENPSISVEGLKLELQYFFGKKKRPVDKKTKKKITLFGFIESFIEEEKRK